VTKSTALLISGFSLIVSAYMTPAFSATIVKAVLSISVVPLLPIPVRLPLSIVSLRCPARKITVSRPEWSAMRMH